MTEIVAWVEFLKHDPIVFYAAVFLSSLLSTLLDIGSFVLIPLFAIHFGAKESVAVITLFFIFQNLNKIVLFWRHIDWAIARKLVLYGIPGAVAGSVLLVHIPVDWFQKVLGVGLILLILGRYAKIGGNGLLLGRFTVPCFGVLYGFASGVLGSGNVIKGPLLTAIGVLKERYIATYAISSLLMNIPKLTIYRSADVVSWQVLTAALPLLAISIVATYLGKRWLALVPERGFALATNAVFLLSAIALLF